MMSQKPRILFVDDEERVLKGFKRLLFRYKSQWQLHFCTDPLVVESLITQHSYQIVIVDMRMPEMNGVEVLSVVRRVQPECIRIILSGQSSDEMIQGAVEVAHQFLAKPCEEGKLVDTIKSALSMVGVVTKLQNAKLNVDLANLPDMPSILQEVESLLKREDCTCEAVGNLVSRDPVLAAKLLKVVNSAFMGLPKEVYSISEAINYLGCEKLKILILAAELFDKIDPELLQRFNLDHIWMQSIRAQSLLKALSRTVQLDVDEIEMINAVLMFQGIGEISIATQLPEQYAEILSLVKDQTASQTEVESKLIGVNHIHVSAFILGVWGLPNRLLELVLELASDTKQRMDTLRTLLKAVLLLSSHEDWDVISEQFAEHEFPEEWLAISGRVLGHG